MQPLEPLAERSESDQDRLAALSLFGAARMREQQDDRHGALRFYQRALRRDPHSLTVLREIVPLSMDLGRADEAMRYAAKVTALDPSDGLILRRLVLHFAVQGEYDEALELFERAMASELTAENAADHILLSSQMTKFYLTLERVDRAADLSQQVLAALYKPADFGLEDRLLQAILEDGAREYESLDVAVGGKDSPEAMALCFYGHLLLDAKRPVPARRAFERAEELDPQPARRHLNEALLLEAEGQPDPALGVLESFFATQQVAQGRAPYQLLGRLLDWLDRSDEFAPRLEALRNQMPDNQPLAIELAHHYRSAAQFEQAKALYTELLKKGPHIEGYRGLIDVYRQSGENEALLDVLSDSLAQLQSLDLLGEEGNQLSADRSAVEALFDTARGRASSDEPFEFDTAQAMATLALETADYDTAGEFFQRALQADPKAKLDVLRQWGLGLLFREQYAAAADVLRRAADEAAEPVQQAEYLYHLSGALAMDAQFDPAIAAATRAAELAEPHREQLGGSYFVCSVGRLGFSIMPGVATNRHRPTAHCSPALT